MKRHDGARGTRSAHGRRHFKLATHLDFFKSCSNGSEASNAISKVPVAVYRYTLGGVAVLAWGTPIAAFAVKCATITYHFPYITQHIIESKAVLGLRCNFMHGAPAVPSVPCCDVTSARKTAFAGVHDI